MDFWLYKQAQQNGHHIAITDGQESYTYQNLYCEASLLAKRLKAYQQSRVGLYIDNSIQSIILIHACWLANIEIAMINTRLTPNEMTNQMRSNRCTIDFLYLATGIARVSNCIAG